MKFLEKNLEDIIWESDNIKLQERGLDIKGKKFRQLRIGNYGISDIITVKRDLNWTSNDSYLKITVYELKKEKAGISAFLQAIRYCQGIKSYLEKRNIYKFTLDIVLLANQIDTQSDYIFISNLLKSSYPEKRAINSIKNYEYKYNIDGICFKEIKDMDLVNTGF